MTWIKYQGGRGANYVAEISACSANVSATINAKGFSPSFDSLYEFLDFPGGSVVKNMPANKGDMGSIPGQEDPLEKEMATHSSVLAWKSHG